MNISSNLGNTVLSIQLWLDDERVAPPGWQRVYWPSEAIALLEAGNVAVVSLDHDLGDDAKGTGYDVIAWIEHAVVTRAFKPPRLLVHTANPAARVRMLAGIDALMRIHRIQARGEGPE